MKSPSIHPFEGDESVSTTYAGDWVIEFRNGSFFQNIEAETGGPLETAHRFASREDIDRFYEAHGWILANGAMALYKPDPRAALTYHLAEAKRLIREAWDAWDSDDDVKCGKRIGATACAIKEAVKALEGM